MADISTSLSRHLTSMSRYAGIVHHSPDQNLLHLPLQEVDVKVWMVDVSARVVLSQVFENVSESPTSRAKYVFPLPASAAACAFELEHADGRVIVGDAKEKSEAAQTFQSALDAGKSAGLVEQVTDDIFTISIGSIPARQKVTARLTFVMDLLDEGRQDYVRLQLPMAIAERYGETPAAMLDASTANEKTIVKIAVDIQTSEKIQEIRSPTHPTITYKRHKSRTGRKSERRMAVTWSSTTFLDGDFVLTVHALGLDKPRCFAEIDPQRGDTIAMQLLFVPKFKMPPVTSQEYIFVIDRSGSMAGAPMETAKRTLEMLLHLLPDSQTTFNIFSFGSEVDGLWGKSASFDQSRMRHAISSVKGMQANYGGTEIAKALQFAIASRNHGRPTAMFVLTDGDIAPSDNLDPFTVVSTAVKSCRPDAPLRVFTLGIGESVSSAMCERLAREGGGECLFAVRSEDITGKCARLLNAGRTREIESVTVDWHGSGSPPAVNFSPLNRRNPLPPSVVQLEPPPQIQQAPHTITKIFPGIRFNVFAITTFRSVPREVRLRAKVKDLEEVLELVVPVTEVKPFKDEWTFIPLVHTLAARELIKQLGDSEGKALLPKPITSASDEDIRKAAIVRLGLEYQLVSQHTSFVAVESGRETARNGLRRSKSWQRSRQQHGYASVTAGAADGGNPGIDMTTVQTVWDSLSQAVYAAFSFFFSDPPPTTRSRQKPLPGTYYSAAQSRSGSPSIQSEHSFRYNNSSTDTFSTLSSLEGSSSSRWSYSRPSSPVPPPEDPIQRVPSPVFDSAPPGTGQAAPPLITASHPPPVPEEVETIISLQSFDGSFTPSPQLGALVGVETLAKAAEQRVDGKIWATAVVVAYLKHHLAAQPDLLDALLNKALDYVEGGGASLLVGRDFWDLVNIAGQSVGSR
ncbi:hypothetical protein DEU56DRAFT_822144 [Suillus clintonianus]|uniref:uncharacterized protein n=1 Tax=Suillus clintonianus TaxID=1904413 RepID=UPI001B8847FC|nr:uncharacterized protein DEU56DRAFT_822144 [Suillus clintonianus]KAG2126598.1 hypothetical protein DEU56DRAFT_822144 [Suillus clintonianus]